MIFIVTMSRSLFHGKTWGRILLLSFSFPLFFALILMSIVNIQFISYSDSVLVLHLRVGRDIVYFSIITSSYTPKASGSILPEEPMSCCDRDSEEQCEMITLCISMTS